MRLPCFPRAALFTRRSPSLGRVPLDRVPRCQRYHESATTPHSSCRAPYGFAAQFRALSLCSLPAVRDDPAGPGSFGFREPDGNRVRETMGPHRFLGDPSCTSALVNDPGRTRCPSHWRSDACCPRAQHGEGSNGGDDVEAQSHSFGTCCLRFTPALPRHAQDSLPAGC